MAAALELAQLGRGCVEPNPMVGAIIVRDGQRLGQGYHARFGQAHAEVRALEDCLARGHDPAGATIYVTLEPCAHHGKTPPCAQALIDANIARAVVAMQDPFPQVAGRGIAMLRSAGIDISLGVLEREARRLNEPFIKRTTTAMPWTIAKWAQTLDGKIATASNHSQWISNPASRRRVHELRARVDAILVGIDTAIADDPMLNARDVEVRRIARRVLIDAQLKAPASMKLLQHPDPPVTVATSEKYLAANHPAAAKLRDRGIEVIGLPPFNDRHLDLTPLLKHLAHAHQATNLLVEGGARVIGSMLQQQLVDQLLIFIAPKLLGDHNARSAVQGFNPPAITDAIALHLRSTETIDGDLMLDYRLTPSD